MKSLFDETSCLRVIATNPTTLREKLYVPLRAVRKALYVLSMTYMPSVTLYVVGSTFKGRFDPHYPPQAYFR